MFVLADLNDPLGEILSLGRFFLSCESSAWSLIGVEYLVWTDTWSTDYSVVPSMEFFK